MLLLGMRSYMMGSIFGSGVGGLDDAVGWVCPGSLPFIYVESQMSWRCIRIVQNSSIASTNRLGMRWRRRWWAYLQHSHSLSNALL